jgi:hypothetical protein
MLTIAGGIILAILALYALPFLIVIAAYATPWIGAAAVLFLYLVIGVHSLWLVAIGLACGLWITYQLKDA